MTAALEIDDRQLTAALAEIERDLPAANRDVLTDMSRDLLVQAVKGMGYRTGNMRSSALKVWRRLDIPGRPLTKVEDGVKTLTYTRGRREITNKYASGSAYDDQRQNKDTPSFSWALWCAEWRENNSFSGADKARRALDSNRLPSQLAAKFRTALATGDYNSIVDTLASVFGVGAKGGTLIDAGAGGYWKYYMGGTRGKSATMDVKKAERRYAKLLKERSAR